MFPSLGDPKLFWRWVEPCAETGCWVWTGSTSNEGYGRIARKVDGKKKFYAAHRVAYFLTRGSIASDLCVDHQCHNADKDCQGGRECRHRRCVNPDHLDSTTWEINIARGARGRFQSEPGFCRNGHEISVVGRIGADQSCAGCNQDRCERYRNKKKAVA